MVQHILSKRNHTAFCFSAAWRGKEFEVLDDFLPRGSSHDS
jgi:hypothetical protein